MNKTKSTKRQVVRFLFLLPVLAVILLSFRKSFSDSSATEMTAAKPVFTDTIPEVKEPNNKGFLIDVKDKNGECLLVIKDKNKKEVTRMLLTEWNKKADYYENLYGEIPPAPAKPGEAAVLPTLEQWVKSANKDVKSVSVINGLATITLNNGKTENYDLTNKEQKINFEKKYGEVSEPPLPPVAPKEGEPTLPPVPPTPPTPPSKVIGVKEKADVKANYDLKDDVITVKLKDGRKEVYDLRNTDQKKQFTEKYGDPVLVSDISTTANINVNSKINQALVTTVKSNLVSNNNINAVTIANSDLNTTVNAANINKVKLATTVSSPLKTNISSKVNVAVEPVLATTVDANIDFDVVITITKNTTPAELDKLITKIKEKGYELKFTNKNYNDGMLTNISGVIKYKESSSTFSVTDFSDVTIAVFREGDKVSFKILTDIKKAVI